MPEKKNESQSQLDIEEDQQNNLGTTGLENPELTESQVQYEKDLVDRFCAELDA